jgi:hypothetical protein
MVSAGVVRRPEIEPYKLSVYFAQKITIKVLEWKPGIPRE